MDAKSSEYQEIKELTEYIDKQNHNIRISFLHDDFHQTHRCLLGIRGATTRLEWLIVNRMFPDDEYKRK